MNKTPGWKKGALAAAALAVCAASARAELAMSFDSAAPSAGKAPSSLLQSVREATKDLELPAVVATKETPAPKPIAASADAKKPAFDPRAAAQALPKGASADPAFWGTDGQWCRDDGTYVGGPCDNTGHWPGGDRDPWARDPSREGWGNGRSPYDDPWYREPYRRDPYDRDPYYREPYRRDRGPYREPYRRRGPYRRY